MADVNQSDDHDHERDALSGGWQDDQGRTGSRNTDWYDHR